MPCRPLPFLLKLQWHLGATLSPHHLILLTSQRPLSKSHHFFLKSPTHELFGGHTEATEVTKASKCHQPHPKHCHELCHHLVLLRSFESTSLSSPQTHHVTSVVLPPKCDRLTPAHRCSHTLLSSDIIAPTSVIIITTVPPSTTITTTVPRLDLHPTSHCHQPLLILCCRNCRHLHH